LQMFPPSHLGRDRGSRVLLPVNCVASIHGPAGARLGTSRMWKAYFLFQSTHPREARQLSYLLSLCRVQFQSTRPHVARRTLRTYSNRSTSCFNPRTHVGTTFPPFTGTKLRVEQVFQPTHPMGATLHPEQIHGMQSCGRCSSLNGFNARAHVERDLVFPLAS
jgi:hypothetical protein